MIPTNDFELNHESLDNLETSVAELGPCPHDSPLLARKYHFADDLERILVSPSCSAITKYTDKNIDPPSFERAGPRRKIFFDPQSVTCGIVTCGGLCPGLNDVIRAITLTATYSYGVKRILGFRYGYAGLSSNTTHQPMELTAERVKNIHQLGGTILGSSRGPQDLADMVKNLRHHQVDILFTIGGDGTLHGAKELAAEIERQSLPISVIGIPKTIDNDLHWVTRSFGFNTSVDEARQSIAAAHVEAIGALNGVGIVKLMGRNAGFIAAHATLADPDVNFCLVPEVPFRLDGENGLLALLEKRLALKHHAVIVAAEGAGQDLIPDTKRQLDASGNLKNKDIGIFLCDEIKKYFEEKEISHSVKYIDPSYIIRSLPANALDSEFCLSLGQTAVHAGMAGKTNMFVGYWNTMFTHVPLSAIVGRQRTLDPEHDPQWQRVLEATGQPQHIG